MKKIAMALLISSVLWITCNGHASDTDAYLQKVRIHGFVSQGYLISDKNDYFFADTEDGTFQFNETALNFLVTPADDLRLGVQFLSRDLGQFGNNDIEIDWAFGDYRFRDWLGVRAGRLKNPTGLYNQTRDIDAARSCILLPSSLYNEAFRETQTSVTGLGIYGILPYGFEYQVQCGKMEIESQGATARAFASGLPFSHDEIDIETNDDTISFHLEWFAPLDGLRFVGTYMGNLSWETKTPIGIFDTDVDSWLVGTEFTYRDFTIALEYKEVHSHISTGGRTLQDFTDQGYYGMVGYRFNEWFEAGTYYSRFFGDKDDKKGDRFEKQGSPKELAWLHDCALFVRFDINEYWIFKLEGHYFDGLNRIVSSQDGEPDPDAFMFAAKTTFSF